MKPFGILLLAAIIIGKSAIAQGRPGEADCRSGFGVGKFSADYARNACADL